MFKTLQNAVRSKDVRKKLIFTFLMLVVVRLGSQLPVPGTDATYLATIIDNGTDVMGFFNSITGGSFESFSIFALSITPYITSSIIMQLLTIAIPRLEELQKDGNEGKKKIAEYTRYVTVALAVIESIAMAVGFGSQGLLEHYTWYNVAVVVISLTAGSAFLMWVGEQITQNGIGNGISMILLFNIVSRLPQDFVTLSNRFVAGQTIAMAIVAIVIIAAAILAMVAFVVLLQGGQRKIPVQYAQKVQGRRSIGGQASNIPMKVNTAGVIPVIFASSLMSLPVMISQFFTVDYTTFGGKVLLALTSSSWCRLEAPGYTVGLLFYVALIYAFAYFYTSVSFNPMEIANNMKKQGGFIPGIRPGKPTSDYLNHILNYIVFIGATGLTIVAVVPIIITGLANMTQLSFAGTSLIIVVGVILETLKQIESSLLVRSYKGFLND